MPSAFTLRAPSLGHSYVGKNAVGASFEAPGASTWTAYAKPFTLTSPAFLAAIEARVKGNNNNFAALFASLWDDNGGSPGKVVNVGNTNGGTNPGTTPGVDLLMLSTDRWLGSPIGAFLTPATYWMVVVLGATTSGAMNIAYDTSGTDKVSAAVNVTALNEGWSWGAGSSRDYSIRGSILS